MRARVLVVILAICCLANPVWADEEDDEDGAGAHDGMKGVIGFSLGNHNSWKFNFPAFSPVLMFSPGYQVSPSFLARIDLGLGYSRIVNSEMSSLEGANVMYVSGTVTLLYTPRLSKNLYLYLGGAAGTWLTTLWGDNLLGTTSGQVVKSLDDKVFTLGGLAGLEWNLAPKWALVFETRYYMANCNIGGQSMDTGGLTVSLGFVYRIKLSRTGMPK